MKKLLIPIFLLLLCLSACTAKPADELEGSSWQLVSLGEQLPLNGTTLTISFKEGQAGGSSGCNTFSADYQVEDGQIQFGEIAVTLMACMDDGVMEQEQAYLNFLQSVTGYSLAEGKLSLYQADGSALIYMPGETR